MIFDKNSKSQFLKLIKDLKFSGKKIVFTNGCFDILHKGHILYLKEAKKLGDFLVVAINSDDSIKKLKGEKRPIISQKDRALILSELKCVDCVYIFDELDPLNIIREISPDVLVKGGDWELSKIIGKDFVEKSGGKVYSLSHIEGVSSSKIIEDIIEKFKVGKMYTISIKGEFSAAHKLVGSHSKCNQIHGHNFKVIVEIGVCEISKNYMVMDFLKAEEILNKILEKLDHKYLNELEMFSNINPTSESLAKYIFDEFYKSLNLENLKYLSIEVLETDKFSAKYFKYF